MADEVQQQDQNGAPVERKPAANPPVESRFHGSVVDDAKPSVTSSRVATWGARLELVSKLVSLLTWPVVVLIAVAVFYSPMRRIADMLPEKFEQSSEIGIAGISVKIAEQAKASGNAELAKIISGLSEDAIEWLLKIGDGSHRVIGSDDGRTGTVSNYVYRSNPGWKELEASGLLKADVPLAEYDNFFKSLRPVDDRVPKSSLSRDQEDRLLRNSVRLSDSGLRAYRIVISVVADVIGNKRAKAPSLKASN